MFILACLLGSRPTLAQEPADPASAARFHWGVLRFTPSIAISNFGVDNNVFNDPSDPRSDTTGTVGPVVDLWMHVGRGRISGRLGGQYVYFKEFDNQRGWNTDEALRFELPFARLTPFIEGKYVNTRSRPGFEIDSRARQLNRIAAVGAELRLSAKTSIIVSEEFSQTLFDPGETFLGAVLSEHLDRTVTTTQAQMRYSLTPLTTFVVNTDLIRERFEHDQLRDADSLRVMSGFQFKPFALISGSVGVGLRHFDGFDDRLEDYDGLVAAVNASYRLGPTLFSVQVARDLAYSYQAINPYYSLNSIGLSVTERITSVWDVIGTASWQTLDYHQLTTLTGVADVDHVRTYGGGVGYRLGEVVRVGFEITHASRTAPTFGRDYDGLRAGASVSYGR